MLVIKIIILYQLISGSIILAGFVTLFLSWFAINLLGYNNNFYTKVDVD